MGEEIHLNFLSTVCITADRVLKFLIVSVVGVVSVWYYLFLLERIYLKPMKSASNYETKLQNKLQS